jgi:hypothetical protein
MRTPSDVLVWLKRRYIRQRRRWLDGNGTWPLEVSLGKPSQKEVFADPAAARSWVVAWSDWTHAINALPPDAIRPELRTVTLAWPSLGAQVLPEALSFASAEAVAHYCGDGNAWRRIAQRRHFMLERWPALIRHGFGPHDESLSTYDERDFGRLIDLLEWLEANPRSGLYLRQLPVPGIDTKWVDRRRGLVADLLTRITMDSSPNGRTPEPASDIEAVEVDAVKEAAKDFFNICGLRRPSPKMHILVLCPQLSSQLGGLRDIESPVEQIAALPIRPKRVLVVENRDTGLCLPDIPDTLAVIKLGNAVSLLKQLPWLKDANVFYWGDIDTFGFSILAQARKVLPSVTSVLMDAATLVGHLDRLVDESEQAKNVAPQLLTESELSVYMGLLQGTWGESKRLEQERLEWPAALATLLRSLNEATTCQIRGKAGNNQPPAETPSDAR